MSTAVTWTPYQWGVSAAGVWNDIPVDDVNGDITLQINVNVAGVIFNAASFQSLTTSGGRVLDAPILSVTTLSFYATHIPASVGPWTVEVGLVPDAAPVDYSSTALPWNRSEISLGTFDMGSVPSIPDTLLETLTLDATLIRAWVTSRGRWSGKLALSFRLTTSGNTLRLKNGPSFPVQLATTQDLFFSGLAGGPYGGPVRVLRDGRFAMPMFSGGLIEDGDQPNLWVRAFDADPFDPEQEYRPRPGEGTVHDKVPNP